MMREMETKRKPGRKVNPEIVREVKRLNAEEPNVPRRILAERLGITIWQWDKYRVRPENG